MRGNPDKTEKDLFAELSRLRKRMEEIYRHGGCQDPDSKLINFQSQ